VLLALCRSSFSKDFIMKRILTPWLALSFLCIAPIVKADPAYDMGKILYQENCASCHGPGGKGDGGLRAYLVKEPSDLTTITRRNQGVFPHQRVWDIIDGRSSVEIGPHGSREMPVWGTEFKTKALRESGVGTTEQGPYGAMPYGGMHRGMGSEWHVRQKISALVDFLQRLQVR